MQVSDLDALLGPITAGLCVYFDVWEFSISLQKSFLSIAKDVPDSKLSQTETVNVILHCHSDGLLI